MPIAEFLIAVLLLELTPGPNMGYLASLALSRGRLAGLIATGGVAAGLGVHAIVAALGAGTLIQASPLVYELLRWLGVGYLLLLAFEGWRGETETSPGTASIGALQRGLLWRGFLSNIFNPKSVLFFISVVPRFVTAAGPPIVWQMAVLGALYVAVATGVHAAVVLLASRLQPWIVAGPQRDRVRKFLSVLLAIIALWLAWTTRR